MIFIYLIVCILFWIVGTIWLGRLKAKQELYLNNAQVYGAMICAVGIIWPLFIAFLPFYAIYRLAAFLS